MRFSDLTAFVRRVFDVADQDMCIASGAARSSVADAISHACVKPVLADDHKCGLLLTHDVLNLHLLHYPPRISERGGFETAREAREFRSSRVARVGIATDEPPPPPPTHLAWRQLSPVPL